ncbi:hypothetical protein BDFB_003421 [Asbolus verrucosus]|uniref:Uncharacterized protein n=1 Tax=Asbolus verrucosus TaxID=1661398 RepID=A0A482VYY8_ASBVE|nr:hypothetical protein BDFB_003421 [Asbolus verrucosus]
MLMSQVTPSHNRGAQLLVLNTIEFLP